MTRQAKVFSSKESFNTFVDFPSEMNPYLFHVVSKLRYRRGCDVCRLATYTGLSFSVAPSKLRALALPALQVSKC